MLVNVGKPPGGPAAPPQRARLGYPEGVVPSEAERHLVQVCGYHLHHNNGCHVDKGIADDEV